MTVLNINNQLPRNTRLLNLSTFGTSSVGRNDVPQSLLIIRYIMDAIIFYTIISVLNSITLFKVNKHFNYCYSLFG